jgi:hypothetical protein
MPEWGDPFGSSAFTVTETVMDATRENSGATKKVESLHPFYSHCSARASR